MVCSAFEHLLQGGGQEHRHLRRTIGGDTRQLIVHRFIGEAFEHCVLIRHQVHIARRVEQWQHDRVQKTVQQYGYLLIAHGLGDFAITEQQSGVGEREVARVENADLHLLPQLHLVTERNAHLLECRAAVGEAVLDDPLAEIFCDEGYLVGQATRCVEARNVLCRHRRGDAVDERVREHHGGIDPCAEFLVQRAGEADEGGARDFAVVAQVVARHDGEGFRSRRTSPRQGFGDETEHRAWITVAGQVVRNVGMVGEEHTRFRVDVIAALCDRQRHDAKGRIGQQLEYLGRLLRREQVVELSTDDAHTRIAVGRCDRERIQTVLRPELIGLLPPPFAAGKADTDDAPIALVRQSKTPIDVERLMRAVEVADTEMGDTAFEVGSVVGRRGDVRTAMSKALPSLSSVMVDPPNKQCLLLAEQPKVGRLAEQVFENLVALGVVGLTHVFVPRGPRTEHLEHHPGVRIILWLQGNA